MGSCSSINNSINNSMQNSNNNNILIELEVTNDILKHYILNDIITNKIKSEISFKKIRNNIYVEEFNFGYLIFFHDKFLKNLPIKGWIHNCIICYGYTSNIGFYQKKFNCDIYLQICPNCIYKLNK